MICQKSMQDTLETQRSYQETQTIIPKIETPYKVPKRSKDQIPDRLYLQKTRRQKLLGYARNNDLQVTSLSKDTCFSSSFVATLGLLHFCPSKEKDAKIRRRSFPVIVAINYSAQSIPSSPTPRLKKEPRSSIFPFVCKSHQRQDASFLLLKMSVTLYKHKSPRTIQMDSKYCCRITFSIAFS